MPQRKVICLLTLAATVTALIGAGCVVARPGSVAIEIQPRCAAAAPAPIRGGRLQAFVEGARCYPSLPRVAHTPAFRIAPVEERKYRGEFFWILDGGQRIGLLNLSFGELEMFRFFPPHGGVPVDYKMPAFVGWDSLQGPRISIVPQGTWSGRGRMTQTQTDGATLGLHYREEFDGGTELVHQFLLRFDPVLGYIWDCTFDLRMDKPEKFEYANLLPKGVADSRDERKRYQKCLWTRRDGALCFMYQNPRSMMQSFGSEWTDIPEDGGFVGFVSEPDVNPFVEIVHSDPRTTLVTCSVWYDQHVKAVPPERKGSDGFYHVSATYRFLSLPLPVAKELEDAARTMLPASERAGPMGFRQGVVNDFETTVPAGTLFNGCIWGHSAKHDGMIGRSGTHSLRLHGNETAQPVHGGPLLHVEAGRRYRLSVWARTRGVTGKGAYLRLRKQEDAPDARQSRRLTGDTDWTRLEIVFTPAPGEPFAVPGLVVEGPGKAWFDDMELTELE